MDMRTPTEILKDNPVLDAALDCIVYKTHPVIKFHYLQEDNKLTLWNLETKFRGIKAEIERDKLLLNNPEYVFFETQIKQCLMGFEKFCTTYNLKFD